MPLVPVQMKLGFVPLYVDWAVIKFTKPTVDDNTVGEGIEIDDRRRWRTDEHH